MHPDSMPEIRTELIYDLSDRDISLGDYISLHGLSTGDLIFLKNDEEDKAILIGNGTAFEGVSSASMDGWDYKLYNAWKVDKVCHIKIEQHWLSPDHVATVQGVR